MTRLTTWRFLFFLSLVGVLGTTALAAPGPGQLLLTISDPNPASGYINQFGTAVATLGNAAVISAPYNTTDGNGAGLIESALPSPPATGTSSPALPIITPLPPMPAPPICSTNQRTPSCLPWFRAIPERTRTSAPRSRSPEPMSSSGRPIWVAPGPILPAPSTSSAP